MATMPAAAELDALAAFDTPTICNAIERLAPHRRAHGFTHRGFLCGFPALRPVVGYACTAAIRSRAPPATPAATARALRDDYYRAIAAGPRPSVVVIEDLDEEPGYGAFWGEVQSAIHVGLGARALLTNGAVRDLDTWAPGFQFLAGCVAASHAHAAPVRVGGNVRVFGLVVRPGDLLHADRHGAVIVPLDLVAALPDAARAIAGDEARILAVARGPECTAERLIEVFRQLDATH
jgi:regulator of RNase E activity RraA